MVIAPLSRTPLKIIFTYFLLYITQQNAADHYTINPDILYDVICSTL
jgi:hypothetical protein